MLVRENFFIAKSTGQVPAELDLMYIGCLAVPVSS